MTAETSLAPRQQFDLSPQTFEQALTFAGYMADSDMVPKDFKGKPGNCLIAMQWGAEVGLKPMQALQNIAVINGRPALWGDSVIALVRSSPLCEYVSESDDGKTATCKVKRRGEPEQERTFSMEDAKLAGLLGKQGPWTQYPKRMRQMRARAFALRDVFPDVLKGLPVAEEVMDTPIGGARDMGPVDEVKPTPQPYPAEQFDKNFPQWEQVIKSRRKTVDELIAFAQSRNPNTPFSEDQLERLRAVQPVKNAEATDVTPKNEPAPASAAVVPAMTFAQVADKLNAAKDPDALNVAADLIAQVPDSEQQAELNAIYERRIERLQ